MHSLQPQQNAQLRPRGHDENILEEAYRGRYARQRLLNFWPESSCGYHAIKRFVCIIQVLQHGKAPRRGDFLLTTFPIADANQPAPSPIVFPQIVDGGGSKTQSISGATSA